jgi:DNA-binding XRE family transcriptional regulator
MSQKRKLTNTKLFRIKRNITSHLKQLRQFRKITQREMGEVLGISCDAYRVQYERACKKIPPKDIRDKICAKLQFSEKQIWPTIEEEEI